MGNTNSHSDEFKMLKKACQSANPKHMIDITPELITTWKSQTQDKFPIDQPRNKVQSTSLLHDAIRKKNYKLAQQLIESRIVDSILQNDNHNYKNIFEHTLDDLPVKYTESTGYYLVTKQVKSEKDNEKNQERDQFMVFLITFLANNFPEILTKNLIQTKVFCAELEEFNLFSRNVTEYKYQLDLITISHYLGLVKTVNKLVEIPSFPLTHQNYITQGSNAYSTCGWKIVKYQYPHLFSKLIIHNQNTSFWNNHIACIPENLKKKIIQNSSDMNPIVFSNWWQSLTHSSKIDIFSDIKTIDNYHPDIAQHIFLNSLRQAEKILSDEVLLAFYKKHEFKLIPQNIIDIVRLDYQNVFEYLYQHDIQIPFQVVNGCKQNILHLSLINKNQKLSQFILDNYSQEDYSSPDTNGHTVLSYAIDAGFSDIAMILYQSGTSNWEKNMTIVRKIVEKNMIDIFQLMIPTNQINWQHLYPDNNTLLSIVAQYLDHAPTIIKAIQKSPLKYIKQINNAGENIIWHIKRRKIDNKENILSFIKTQLSDSNGTSATTPSAPPLECKSDP